MAFPDDFVDPAFEEQPRGRTRVFRGNHEAQDAASRDDPLVQQLVDRVADLLARVESLEERIQTLEGDLSDDPTEFDDEPPI